MVFSEITGFGNYCSLRPETLQMQTTYEVNKGEYSRSRSFHYDLILQDQALGERSQDQWSSGFNYPGTVLQKANFGLSLRVLTENKYFLITIEHFV